MSAREPGKTTTIWVRKIYNGFKKDFRPWIFLTRQIADITPALIEDIFSRIEKHTGDVVKFTFDKGSLKNGIVDVRIEGKTFFRIVALSLPLRRLKLSSVQSVKGVFFDEYIIDPRSGEKYLSNEGFKIKECYSTWRRENPEILFYFAANPYSLFNPLFVEFNIPLERLRRGEILAGDFWVVEWALMSPELREKILAENPLAKFDENYAGYALDGNAIYDKNILLGAKPENFPLSFIFKIGERFIGISQNTDYTADISFYAEFITEYSRYRQVFCLDLSDMIAGSQMMTTDDRIRFSRFKRSIASRRVMFADINVYYMILEIYKVI